MTFGKDLIALPRKNTEERILRVFGAAAPKATVVVCDKPALPPEIRYVPSPPIHFCVELDIPEPVKRTQLFEVFTQDWFRSARFPDLCGHDMRRGEVFFVGTPASVAYGLKREESEYDRVYFALDVIDEEELRTADEFAAMAAKIASVSTWPSRALVAPEEAAREAEKLFAIQQEFRGELGFRVVAPDAGFLGRSIWNVLHTIGLRWGDMDLFNWVTEDAWNDVAMFWVGTSTEPGYFIPEEIVANKRYADLTFSMAIGAKPAPEAIAAAMVAIASDAAKRLKGTLDDDAQTFVERVRDVHAHLTAIGYPPGAPQTTALL